MGCGVLVGARVVVRGGRSKAVGVGSSRLLK
jgi:hypothetical protein